MPVARVWDTGPLSSCGGHTAHLRALTPPRAWSTERLKGARTCHTWDPAPTRPTQEKEPQETPGGKRGCRPSHRPCAPTPGPSQPRRSAAPPSGQRRDGRGCQPAPATASWPSEDPTPGLRTPCAVPLPPALRHANRTAVLQVQSGSPCRQILEQGHCDQRWLERQTDSMEPGGQSGIPVCLCLSLFLSLCHCHTHTLSSEPHVGIPVPERPTLAPKTMIRESRPPAPRLAPAYKEDTVSSQDKPMLLCDTTCTRRHNERAPAWWSSRHPCWGHRQTPGQGAPPPEQQPGRAAWLRRQCQ